MMPMPYKTPWIRHVGNVSAELRLFCPELRHEEITQTLGVKPTSAQTARERASFTPNAIIGAKDCTLWCYSTASQVHSFELNQHLRHLVGLFLPLKSRIEELRPIPVTSVHVYWESTIAGAAGPLIDAECISGLAALGASLGIRVAEIDKVSDG